MVLGDACVRALHGATLLALLVGPLAAPRPEPCAGSPLCSCRDKHMSCIAVPLHRFPGGLILTGNPLRCECELAWLGAWLRRWLQENEAGAELRRAVRGATCKDQLGRRVPLLQLRADEAECHASALSSDAQPKYTHASFILALLWTLIFR
ncbi:uncharacterized protein LOC133522152 isoform X2 [Cydia pomonella]|uniref:uncharacterized protein LOC133522152 isoform X2 n=1 Tax=Cydia pomonella TaxID=82600 RepID=UPI002ADDD568|nr:uncharacterized protein LOC133522152 isoform X2 [Cydia pomonella]